MRQLFVQDCTAGQYQRVSNAGAPAANPSTVSSYYAWPGMNKHKRSVCTDCSDGKSSGAGSNECHTYEAIKANVTAADAAFITYATIRSPSVPICVGLTALLCVVLPYTWRGSLPRHVFLCPSFLMAAAFLFVGIPVHYVMAAFLPDTAMGSPAAQRFFADVKRAAVLFIAAHGIITLIRLKYTLTQWRPLIICEVCKAMYIVLLIWGNSFVAESDLSHPAVVRGCMFAFIAMLLVPTLVRAFYVVRCQFEGNQFNHVYFGSESKCPMNKLNLMCLVLEKNPDPTPKITGVDEIETREEVEMGN